jgi:type II secretion system protein N
MKLNPLRLPITRTKVFYSFVFLAAVIFWCLVLFPLDLLPRWIEYKFNDLNDQNHLSITIESARPQYPPGLALKDVRLWWSGMHLLNIDHMQISLGWPSWRPRRLPLRFRAALHGGKMIAQSALDLGHTQGAQNTALHLESIDLQDLPAWRYWPYIDIAGDLSAFINTANLPSNAAGLSLTAQVSIKAFKLTRPSPYPSLATFRFETIEGEVHYAPALVTLQHIHAHGPEIETQFSGQLQVRIPIETSALALSGSVKPQKKLLRRLGEDFPDSGVFEALADNEVIAFSMQGRLQKPSWNFN